MHSQIGASSYYRWSKIHGGCPGSVRLSKDIKQTESPYAKEGTQAHDLAYEILKHIIKNDTDLGFDYTKHDQEMLDAVEVYVEYVLDHLTDDTYLEHKFYLKSIHKDLYGTADCVILDKEKKKITVIDYKHGAGIPVEVEHNLQLMYYGLGALLSMGYPCKTIELVIIQPRCSHPKGPIRSWEFNAVDLIDFSADLKDDVLETQKNTAILNPGGHCRFCPAAASKCPALREKSLMMAKEQFKPDNYDEEKLSKALEFLPAMEAWIKTVREFAYQEATHGRAPKGWKLVGKRPSRKWVTNEKDLITFLTKATGKDESEFYDRKIKSPSKVQRLVSRSITKTLEREHQATVSSGYNLVPEKDKRPAVSVGPQADFKVINEGDIV